MTNKEKEKLIDFKIGNPDRLIKFNESGFDWLNDNIPKPDDQWFEDTKIEYLEKEFEKQKESKLKSLKDAFDHQKRNGKCDSSLGFIIDNRRNGLENDISNVQSLIEVGQTTYYIDVDDNEHESITVEQLQTMKMNMVVDGLRKYGIKKAVKDLINSANNQSELNEININEIEWENPVG